jgi:hypothetical protein
VIAVFIGAAVYSEVNALKPSGQYRQQKLQKNICLLPYTVHVFRVLLTVNTGDSLTT